MSPLQMQELLEKYVNDSISSDELALLLKGLESDANPSFLDDMLLQAWSDTEYAQGDAPDEKQEVLAALRSFMSGDHGKLEVAVEAGQNVGNERRRNRQVFGLYGWRGVAVAAAVVAAIVGTWILYPMTQKAYRAVTPMAAVAQKSMNGTPGTNAAVLTLSDGAKVSLDSAGKAALPAKQGDAKLSNTDNTLAYSAGSADKTNASLYNTLRTERGMRYSVVLSDGTKVWLNAGSSIRYPVAFAGSERKVETSGEVYFEVAPDKARPFKVQSGRTSVTVLGTRFDVIDYDDELDTRVALLQGSVKVNDGSNGLVLSPGKQAAFDRKSGRLAESPLDGERVIAWTKGLLDFKGADFGALMRQIGRWYDVKVVFKGEVPDVHFSGMLHQDVNLMAILDYLSDNGVKYTVKDKTITIIN